VGLDMMDRRDLLRLAVGGLSALYTDTAAPASAAGQVESMRGEASAETEGKLRALRVAESIYINDLVATGTNSRLALRLGKQATVRLGATSKLKIDRYMIDAGGEFELIDGAILFETSGGASASSGVEFRSVYGLIAVRGTRFFAGPSQGAFGVFVAAGRVAVTAANETVVLDPRQGTDIAAPGSPPTKPALWKPPRIRAALVSVT
jgi:ferric-dicitrate binding protein FerR (iron transport regulator)